MTTLVTCPTCHGSGRALVWKHITSTTADSPYETITCYRCGGSGFVQQLTANTIDSYRVVPTLDYANQQAELAALRATVDTLRAGLLAIAELRDRRAVLLVRGAVMELPAAKERIVRAALAAIADGGKGE